MVIRASVDSSIHLLPRLVICAVTFLKTLKSVLYLGTVGVVFVSDYHHLHRGMMLIAEIMPSSININTVGIFGHLVI